MTESSRLADCCRCCVRIVTLERIMSATAIADRFIGRAGFLFELPREVPGTAFVQNRSARSRHRKPSFPFRLQSIQPSPVETCVLREPSRFASARRTFPSEFRQQEAARAPRPLPDESPIQSIDGLQFDAEPIETIIDH